MTAGAVPFRVPFARPLAVAFVLLCAPAVPAVSAAPEPAVGDSLIELPADSTATEVLIDLLAPRLYVPRSAADSLVYLDSLRTAARSRRDDVEARRRIADLLASNRSIEARREAAEALEQALLTAGEDVDLWLRLARLRHRQRFTGHSRQAYRRALELAGNDATVWDELAMLELLRFQRFQDWNYLGEAELVNRRVLDLDPRRGSALRRQIRIACFREDTAQMDALAARWRREDPSAPFPRLVEAMRLTDREDYAGAWREFTGAFALLDSARVHDFLYLGLVDPVAAETLHEDPDSTRAVTDYWRLHDPTPTDDLNPRLLEHYRRMVLADLLFAVEDRGLPGWRHTPGALLVRLGTPPGLGFRGLVQTDTYRLSSTSSYEAGAILVRYGRLEEDMRFLFVDFAMNGVYVRPQSTFSYADEFLAQEGSLYDSPYDDPDRDQEVAVWRFLDENGAGRLDVAIALREREWTKAVLDEPERLLTRLTVYDSTWARGGNRAEDWSTFRKDPFGRLVGVWSLPASGDTFLVGVETTDLDGTGRSALFAPVARRERSEEGPGLSDIALLRDVAFPGEGGAYARLDGSALPNPGGVYRSGEPIGLHFEGYALAVGEDGTHRATLRISLARKGRRGLTRVVLGSGDEGSREMAFDSGLPGPRLAQMLTLELPPLSTGDYVLEVVLEDRTTARRALARAAVRIIGPSEALE